jgi:hypothetical protein
MKRRCLFWLLLFSCLLLINPAAWAQDPGSADDEASSSSDWEFGASIYGWFPDISGRTRFSEGPGGGEIDVPVSDILDNLEFTLMGSFAARKGRWGVFADLIYLDVSASQSVSNSPSIGDVELPVEVTGTKSLDMTSWIVTTAASYRLGDDGAGRRVLDVIGGIRYADISQTLDLQLQGNLPEDFPLSGPNVNIKVSEDVLDYIIGLRGRIAWTEDGAWFTPYYFDIGTGDSDTTWQGMVGVGYAFNWGDVLVAYRHLDYSMPSDRAIDTLEFSGPAVGAVFHF